MASVVNPIEIADQVSQRMIDQGVLGIILVASWVATYFLYRHLENKAKAIAKIKAEKDVIDAKATKEEKDRMRTDIRRVLIEKEESFKDERMTMLQQISKLEDRLFAIAKGSS